jgi:hypothetical protein
VYIGPFNLSVEHPIFELHTSSKVFSMGSPSGFMLDINELHLFGLDSDIFNSVAQDAFLQELDLLTEKLDSEERIQAFSAVTDFTYPIQNLDKTEQQPAPPPATSRRKKVPTLHESDWAPYKERIVELHIRENRPLGEVKEIMEKEFGFCAVYVHSLVHTLPSNAHLTLLEHSIRQYRNRITEWKLDKNIKPAEMEAIVRHRQRRRLLENNKRDLKFRVRGFEVPSQKIERWMKKRGITADMPYAPNSPTCKLACRLGLETYLTDLQQLRHLP